MKRKIIKKKNTGISMLEKKFNTKYEYNADEKVYIDDDKVINEEYGSIRIHTKISTKIDLDNFIDALIETDIFKNFESIVIYLDIKTFYSGNHYNTMRTTITEMKDGKMIKEEYFSVFVEH